MKTPRNARFRTPIVRENGLETGFRRFRPRSERNVLGKSRQMRTESNPLQLIHSKSAAEPGQDAPDFLPPPNSIGASDRFRGRSPAQAIGFSACPSSARHSSGSVRKAKHSGRPLPACLPGRQAEKIASRPLGPPLPLGRSTTVPLAPSAGSENSYASIELI